MENRCNAPYGHPGMMPNLDFNVNCLLYGSPSVSYKDWKKLKKGPFIKWLLTGGKITEDEYFIELEHIELSEQGKCHKYRRHVFHFCYLGELLEFERRLNGN